MAEPLYYTIKIWTTQPHVYKHPEQFTSFEAASTAKEELDHQLREDTILVLKDPDRGLDLTINTNQIVSIKVMAIFDNEEQEGRPPLSRR